MNPKKISPTVTPEPRPLEKQHPKTWKHVRYTPKLFFAGFQPRHTKGAEMKIFYHNEYILAFEPSIFRGNKNISNLRGNREGSTFERIYFFFSFLSLSFVRDLTEFALDSFGSCWFETFKLFLILHFEDCHK